MCPIALLTAGRTNRDAGTGNGGGTVTGSIKRRALSGIRDSMLGKKLLPARQTVCQSNVRGAVQGCLAPAGLAGGEVVSAASVVTGF